MPPQEVLQNNSVILLLVKRCLESPVVLFVKCVVTLYKTRVNGEKKFLGTKNLLDHLKCYSHQVQHYVG